MDAPAEVELRPGTLVIGDLHLDVELADSLARFETWLERTRGAPRLVILGDLFEYWVGPAQGTLPGAKRVTGALRLWDNMWNDEYVRQYRMMDRWGTETLPLAGAYFKQTTELLMWENALHKGTLKIGGRTVDLGRIRVPLLSVVAEHDHIVPYAAAHPLMEQVGSTDKEEVMLKGGHVSLVAGSASYGKLTQLLVQIENGDKRVTGLKFDSNEAFETPMTRRDNPHRAYITIIEGCDKNCAYCVVPYTRGGERGRPIADIVEEVRRLAYQGVKDVTLLVQIVNLYCRH